jgi:hypothetical protein
VHLLVAPQAGPADVAAEVAAVLGLHGRTRHPEQQPRWRDLSTAGVDVVRRVNAVLNVRAAGADRADAVRGCRTVLAAVAPGPAPLAVPEPLRDWVTTRARTVADDLREGGYRVLGDLAQLVPPAGGRPGNLPTGPRRDDVLRVAVEACLHQASAPRKVEQR